MNNYRKFYIRLFLTVTLIASVSYLLSFVFFYYYFFNINTSVMDIEYFILTGIFFIMAISLFTPILSVYSFRIIRRDLIDAKWAFVEYSNTMLKLSMDLAQKKCISCISSLNWSILEEKNFTDGLQEIKRIIGVTKVGLTVFYEIFIVDISQIDETTTSVHCSVRPLSVTYVIGKRRCIKQLTQLMNCLTK